MPDNMRLLYFAPVPMASYWQRPHYFVHHMVTNVDAEVLWVDPYPTRLPRLADFALLRKASVARHVPVNRVATQRAGGLPIEPLAGSELINQFFWRVAWRRCEQFCLRGPTVVGVGRPSKLAVRALRTFDAKCRFLDAMDDYPLFYHGISRRSMSRVERQIADMVDVVICSAPGLKQKFLRMTAGKAAVDVVPNGYDMSRLPPADACTRRAGAAIGFVGTMGEWFDWDLVVELARALPEQQVQLIGPVRSRAPSLPPNVRVSPECTMHEAIEHCRTFAAGLIPFKINALTASVDPIKFYELRALGVPVWTSAFGEMQRRIEGGQAERIEKGMDWRSLWARTTRQSPSASDIAQFREQHDWQGRFNHAVTLLRSRTRG